MDSTLDGQIHAVFKPFDNLIKPLLKLIDSGFKPRDRVVKIGFGRQIRQDVFDQCLVSSGLCARYIRNYARSALERMDSITRRSAG